MVLNLSEMTFIIKFLESNIIRQFDHILQKITGLLRNTKAIVWLKSKLIKP